MGEPMTTAVPDVRLACAKSADAASESVPFFNAAPMHEALKDTFIRDIAALIDSGAFVNGPSVAEFEDAFARFCGTGFCVGVSSGLDALRFALSATGLKPGSEVIVPANTFVATLEAVTQAGGVPVVVDVTEADCNMDVGAAEAAITSRTHALLPVHLYGQMADMQALLRIASRHGCLVIEDACQAHGARRDGLLSGSAGTASAFSFYPTKNLGAMGDAGALVTHDDVVAARTRAFREHGQRRKYEHDLRGYTARLDSIQALVLLRKLPHLTVWNEQRTRAAERYTEALSGIGDLRLPARVSGSEPVWHLYSILTSDPIRLASFLGDRGIATGRHYPQPVHLSPAYSELGYRPGAFPVTEALAREQLSLPLYPGISEAQQAAVVDAVVDYFDRG